MYDQEKAINFSRSDVISSADAIDCLLDFSKGPQAMMVTLLKKPGGGDEENKNFRILEIDSNPISSPYQKPAPHQTAKLPSVTQTITTTNATLTAATTTTSTTTTSPASRSQSTATKPRAICSFCGKSFTHLGDYNKHRRRHTGERPYNCDLCERKFAHASNLARHKRLHSGEKPFQCTTCDKRFSRKDKLSSHAARKSCG